MVNLSVVEEGEGVLLWVARRWTGKLFERPRLSEFGLDGVECGISTGRETGRGLGQDGGATWPSPEVTIPLSVSCSFSSSITTNSSAVSGAGLTSSVSSRDSSVAKRWGLSGCGWMKLGILVLCSEQVDSTSVLLCKKAPCKPVYVMWSQNCIIVLMLSSLIIHLGLQQTMNYFDCIQRPFLQGKHAGEEVHVEAWHWVNWTVMSVVLKRQRKELTQPPWSLIQEDSSSLRKVMKTINSSHCCSWTLLSCGVRFFSSRTPRWNSLATISQDRLRLMPYMALRNICWTDLSACLKQYSRSDRELAWFSSNSSANSMSRFATRHAFWAASGLSWFFDAFRTISSPNCK